MQNECFLIRKFHTAEEAFRSVEKAPPDLALLDVMLPDSDGFSLCRSCLLYTSSILIQAFFRVCQTFQRHHLHIHLHTLAGILHLFIGLCFVGCFGLGLWEHPQLAHDPEQAFRAAGVATLAKPVPEFHHPQCWIPSSHIPDKLQFCLRMLVWMVVWASGLAGEGCHTSIPACLPEVDIRPAFVVLPARTAYTLSLIHISPFRRRAGP